MAIASSASLLDALRQHQILNTKQLEELPALLERFPDPKALAKELIQRDWLTPYQANHLLQGRGQQLVLGSYLLLERLGEGGMGEVFKVRHRKMDRIAALKLIRKERLAHPDAVRRFVREVRAVAALSHPNIVMAYDADQIGDAHMMMMEFVDGATDLSKLVKKNGPLPVVQACEYIRQAALGLQHAFERGLVHRDIKPANLLLTHDARLVKILDMGLARLDPIDDGKSSTMTQQGLVVGTPDYIAPEQAMNSHTVDIRADLYSLGCTLYYLLAGHAPFKGGSVMEKLMKHQMEEPPPIERLRSDVPAEVALVVRTLLAKKPDARYQTPAELASALAPVCRPVSGLTGSLSSTDQMVAVGNPPTTAVESNRDTIASAYSYILKRDDTVTLDTPDRPIRKPSRKHWVLLCATAGMVLFCALAFGLLYFLYQPGADKPREEKKNKVVVERNPPPPKEDDRLKKARELLGGKWYYIGPFAFPDHYTRFHLVHPPEKEINLTAAYPGKNNQPVRWQVYPRFHVGVVHDLTRLFENPDQKMWACLYLYHEIDVPQATSLRVALGSDDTLTVWLNEERLVSRNVHRPLLVHDDVTTLRLKPGKNKLLVKIGQGTGEWGFFLDPTFHEKWDYEQPGFDAWQKQTSELPADKQLAEVVAKLKELNPPFDGKTSHKIDNGVVTELQFFSDSVTDLSPVRALRGLQKLDCRGSTWQQPAVLADLAPLEGMALTSLSFPHTHVADLAPIKDLPLTDLALGATRVKDLTPVQKMPLTSLNIRGAHIDDLSPLRGLKLQHLDCGATKLKSLALLRGLPLVRLTCDWNAIEDLSPLKDAPLEQLNCGTSSIQDLSPIRDARLTSLDCSGSLVTDHACLAHFPLKEVRLDFNHERDLDLLRSIKSLTRINHKPAKEFWQQAEMYQTAFDAWRRKVALLPAAKQVEAVVAKLKEDNPGFDGKATHLIEADAVIEIGFASNHVTNLSALQVLTQLQKLACGGSPGVQGKLLDLFPIRDLPLTFLNCSSTRVADLAPLQGMRLTSLYCGATEVASLAPLKDMPLQVLHCDTSKVENLTPLQDMPLERLVCYKTKVTSLAPLRKLPLKELRCDFQAHRDAAVLRAILTLETINEKQASAFWKEVTGK